MDVINKGKNIAGIEEAAQGIFGVSAADLTVPQAAYLAGLPQSPIVYSPYTADGQLKTQRIFLMAWHVNKMYSTIFIVAAILISRSTKAIRVMTSLKISRLVRSLMP